MAVRADGSARASELGLAALWWHGGYGGAREDPRSAGKRCGGEYELRERQGVVAW